MVGNIWVDGSFLTQKLNPDDVDLLLVIDISDYRRMDAAQLQFFNWFRTNTFNETHKCDNYGIIMDRNHPMGEWNYAYWLKQFGFSRSGDMKGMATIAVPFVVSP
jgi:hypothetical protein